MAEWVSMWLPQNFRVGGAEAFMFSAIFRGDMYSVRAALALTPRPLILLECGPSTVELVDYLSKYARALGQDVFQTPWTTQRCKELAVLNLLTDNDVNGCFLNGQPLAAVSFHKPFIPYIIEGKATEQISGAIKTTEAMITTIRPAMGQIDVAQHKDALQTVFAQRITEFNLFPSLEEKKKTGSFVVLVLHRDTGTKSGVYPEFDSGPALWDIVNTIKSIVDSKNPTKKILPVLCGDVPDTQGCLSMGKYWEKLKNFDEKVPELKGVPQRSIEAYFFQWAQSQGYFDLVVGFRSGQIDLFTFLGIPTLSIGLRNAVGEPRHLMLAESAYKRINVQYDQPRHITTAWRGSTDGKQPLLQCPYWRDPSPKDVDKPRPNGSDLTEDSKRDMLSQEPRDLAPFDKRVLELGLRIACWSYLNGIPQTVKRLPSISGSTSNIITRNDVKVYIPWETERDTAAWTKYFKPLVEEEKKDLATRKENWYNLQESPQKWEEYLSQAKAGWAAVERKTGLTFQLN
jgi:hypothetical protein